MTFGYFLGTIILWLIVAAVFLRFIVRGVINCFKHGPDAPLSNWVGLVIAIILICMLL